MPWHYELEMNEWHFNRIELVILNDWEWDVANLTVERIQQEKIK